MKHSRFICLFLQLPLCKAGETVSIACLSLTYEVDVNEKINKKKADDGKNSKIVHCLLQNTDRVSQNSLKDYAFQ